MIPANQPGSADSVIGRRLRLAPGGVDFVRFEGACMNGPPQQYFQPKTAYYITIQRY